jgi:single-strand DNA-binding protein
MDLNVWAGSGRLIKDPELRKTTSGKALCQFTIACNDIWSASDKKLNGEFFNVCCYDNIGENIAKMCRKGSRVMIEGKINTYNYTDKDGNKRTSFQILAKSVNIVDKPRLEDSLDKEKPETGNLEKVDVADDDLPF